MSSLDEAQAYLYEHLVVTPGGICLSCGELEPCAQRQVANALFLNHNRLPRREPGRAGVVLTHRRRPL